MFAVSIAKSTQAAVVSSSSSKTSLQAQQYAAAEGDIIRYTAYNNLASQSKTAIAGTNFSKEVTIGTETDYTSTIKQKIVTVKIYRGSDALPCYSLDVPRLSADLTGKGVPIGTVITWASDNAPVENGVWLECNGQSCAAYPELARVLGKSTVPDYRERFLETDTTVGTVKEAGLPNIRGDFSTVDAGGLEYPTGSFYNRSDLYFNGYLDYAGLKSLSFSTTNINNIGESYTLLDYLVLFDASRSSSVYGKSSTVQPASVTVRRFIRAA